MTARIALAGALWPVPALGVVTAIVLGVAMRSVDRSLQAAGAGSLRFVFGGDAAAARSVLSAIASALATVTTLLLSLTIVTLQLASTQYSPRLLQDFTRDRVVQACLAVLLGTFVYSLIALRDVRSEATPTASTSVPRMSVTVAVVLAVASVGALVAFIGHQVRNLRVETMMRAVHAEASATLLRLEQRRGHGERAGQEPPAVPPGARRVLARENGFLQKVDAQRLVGTLAAAGVTLRLDRRPGDTVVIGTPIGWAWPDEPERDVDLDDLEAALVEDLVVGFERIDDEDPSYGLRKLADIAVRALSPGINDPTTAVHAMSHLSALLGEAGAVDSWHRGPPTGTGGPACSCAPGTTTRCWSWRSARSATTAAGTRPSPAGCSNCSPRSAGGRAPRASATPCAGTVRG